MMNSRTRSRPPRGRGSSRSFVWKWYQSCGSSLYDWISRAWNVNVSSCVIGRMKRRPARSVYGRSLRSCRGLSPPTARQASAPEPGTPARRSRPSPRGRSARPFDGRASRAAGTTRDPHRPAGCTPRARAACGLPPRRRRVRPEGSGGKAVRRGRSSLSRPGYRGRRERAARYSSGIADASAMASAAGFAIFKRFGRTIPSAIQRSISWNSSSTRMSLETFFSTRPCA